MATSPFRSGVPQSGQRGLLDTIPFDRLIDLTLHFDEFQAAVNAGPQATGHFAKLTKMQRIEAYIKDLAAMASTIRVRVEEAAGLEHNEPEIIVHPQDFVGHHLLMTLSEPAAALRDALVTHYSTQSEGTAPDVRRGNNAYTIELASAYLFPGGLAPALARSLADRIHDAPADVRNAIIAKYRGIHTYSGENGHKAAHEELVSLGLVEGARTTESQWQRAVDNVVQWADATTQPFTYGQEAGIGFSQNALDKRRAQIFRGKTLAVEVVTACYEGIDAQRQAWSNGMRNAVLNSPLSKLPGVGFKLAIMKTRVAAKITAIVTGFVHRADSAQARSDIRLGQVLDIRDAQVEQRAARAADRQAERAARPAGRDRSNAVYAGILAIQTVGASAAGAVAIDAILHDGHLQATSQGTFASHQPNAVKINPAQPGETRIAQYTRDQWIRGLVGEKMTQANAERYVDTFASGKPEILLHEMVKLEKQSPLSQANGPFSKRLYVMIAGATARKAVDARSAKNLGTSSTRPAITATDLPNVGFAANQLTWPNQPKSVRESVDALREAADADAPISVLEGRVDQVVADLEAAGITLGPPTQSRAGQSHEVGAGFR